MVTGMLTPERLGGGQVDDEIELCRPLDRDVGRFGATQYFVDKIGVECPSADKPCVQGDGRLRRPHGLRAKPRRPVPARRHAGRRENRPEPGLDPIHERFGAEPLWPDGLSMRKFQPDRCPGRGATKPAGAVFRAGPAPTYPADMCGVRNSRCACLSLASLQFYTSRKSPLLPMPRYVDILQGKSLIRLATCSSNSIATLHRRAVYAIGQALLPRCPACARNFPRNSRRYM